MKNLKVIIAGSRELHPTIEQLDYCVLHSGFDSGEQRLGLVVCGGAPGVDAAGEAWAKARQRGVMRFMADWIKHGKKAGPMRNRQMAIFADALIAVWNGRSAGTLNMIQWMRRMGKPVHVVTELPPSNRPVGGVLTQ